MNKMSDGYVHGGMDIAGQEKVFDGFMRVTVYGGCVTVLALLLPILIFAVSVAWPMAIMVSFVVGVLMGLGLRLHAGWYGGLISAAVFISLLTALFSAILT